MVISSTATMLINSGVCTTSDCDRAVAHLGKMVVASGGFSGTMIGFVGGGSVPATNELAAEMVDEAPMLAFCQETQVVGGHKAWQRANSRCRAGWRG